MELFQDKNKQLIFNKLSDMEPKSPEEYNRMVGNAVSDLAEIFGIERVEYKVELSLTMLYELYPFLSKTVLYDKGSTENTSVIKLDSAQPMETIFFNVYISKEKKLSPDDKLTLELIFRHFIFKLDSVILLASCEMIYITDQTMGIYNTEGFLRFITMLIQKEELHNYTAIYFNIHNFKSIYKSATYLDASKVLGIYSRIVSNAVTKKELVALIGGDNFVAIVLDSNKDYFLDLIQNMVIKYTKHGETLTFTFGATVGVSKLSSENSPGEVMMNISQAYQSAREKRVSLCYYDKNTSASLIDRKIILSNFAKALADHEFFALYQPKVDAKTNKLLGAEALVRWTHNGQFQMPGNFIPILEKDGCITALDFYMLEEVCKFLSKLRSEKIEMVKISVNFSKRHLSNNRLVEEIAEVIDRYNIPHQYIEIELTESEDYHNQAAMQKIVDDLNVIGIKTSIDDFGTGYSSLSMLKTLQIEELKIDKSFLPKSAADHSDKSLYLLRGVVSLAKNLGLTIVAEGVETTEQLDIIKGMDCDIVQGYIFDKPLPENIFIDRIKQKIYTLDQSE